MLLYICPSKTLTQQFNGKNSFPQQGGRNSRRLWISVRLRSHTRYHTHTLQPQPQPSQFKNIEPRILEFRGRSPVKACTLQMTVISSGFIPCLVTPMLSLRLCCFLYFYWGFDWEVWRELFWHSKILGLMVAQKTQLKIKFNLLCL